MTTGKRQLVLAALVVALGAAVYLNWALSGNTDLQATDALTSSDRQYGETLLVNASGSDSSALASSDNSASANSDTDASSDYFTEARLNREKARDTSVELLEQVLTDASQSDAAKQDAVAAAALIAQNTLQENSIETLVKAKGYEDCVATIDNGECSVVVKTNSGTQDDAIIIKDIVSGQTGISYDKIKIVERQ